MLHSAFVLHLFLGIALHLFPDIVHQLLLFPRGTEQLLQDVVRTAIVLYQQQYQLHYLFRLLIIKQSY